MRKAFITGIAGTTLTVEEAHLVREARPAGLILFARNIKTLGQVRCVIDSFKATVGTEDVLILIDQEGGRVQRVRPPLASRLPPAAAYAAHHSNDVAGALRSAWLVARLLAEELRSFGINCDCAPVLDVPVPGAHDVIGNRAFGNEWRVIAALGKAFAEGLMAGGILPVIKHIPGHGRALADSHLGLPVVTTGRPDLENSDFAPFKALAYLPAAMTAHVVYSAIDAVSPASTSRRVTSDVIRGHCGFDGLLMSDDVGMRALSGSFSERARAVCEAGSDLILHCSGILAEMRDVAQAAPELAGKSLARFERCLATTRGVLQPFDAVEARSVLARLVDSVA